MPLYHQLSPPNYGDNWNQLIARCPNCLFIFPVAEMPPLMLQPQLRQALPCYQLQPPMAYQFQQPVAHYQYQQSQAQYCGYSHGLPLVPVQPRQPCVIPTLSVEPVNVEQVECERPDSPYTPLDSEENVQWIKDAVLSYFRSGASWYGLDAASLLGLLRRVWQFDVDLPSLDDFKLILGELGYYIECFDGMYRYRRIQPLAQLENTKHQNQRPIKDSGENILAEQDSGENILAEQDEASTSEVIVESFQQFDSVEEEDDSSISVGAQGKISISLTCSRTTTYPKQQLSTSKKELANMMKKWRETFRGNLNMLFRFMKLVNDAFEEQDGQFSYSEFDELFGLSLEHYGLFDCSDLLALEMVHYYPDIAKFRVNPVVLGIACRQSVLIASRLRNFLKKLNRRRVDIETLLDTEVFKEEKTRSKQRKALLDMLGDPEIRPAFTLEVFVRKSIIPNFRFGLRISVNEDAKLPEVFF